MPHCDGCGRPIPFADPPTCDAYLADEWESLRRHANLWDTNTLRATVDERPLAGTRTPAEPVAPPSRHCCAPGQKQSVGARAARVKYDEPQCSVVPIWRTSCMSKPAGAGGAAPTPAPAQDPAIDRELTYPAAFLSLPTPAPSGSNRTALGVSRFPRDGMLRGRRSRRLQGAPAVPADSVIPGLASKVHLRVHRDGSFAA